VFISNTQEEFEKLAGFDESQSCLSADVKELSFGEKCIK
jgi:hypothetical protein